MKKPVLLIFFFLISCYINASEKDIAGLISRLNSVTEKQERIRLLKKITYQYLQNNPDSAVYYSNLLIKEAEDPDQLAYGYGIKGMAQVYLGDFESSLKTQFTGLEYAKKSGDIARLGIANNNIGISYDYMGDYSNALKYYKNGLKFRKQINDLEGIEGSLSNIGLVYYLKGDLVDALRYLFAAKNISELMNHQTGIASSSTNIHLIYSQLGDHQKALEYLMIAQRIYEKNQDLTDLSLGYNNLGAHYQVVDKIDSALHYHYKALSIREKLKDRSGVAMSLRNIGSSLYSLDSMEKAESYLLQAVHIADSIPDPVTQIESRKALMELYLKKKEYSKIKAPLEKAFSLIGDGDGYVNAYTLFKTASDYFKATGDHKNAFYYFTKFVAQKDSLQNSENKKMLMKKEIEFLYEKEKREREFKDQQEKLAREARLAKQTLYTWLLGAGFFCLLVLVGFVFRSYTIKRRANNVLSQRNSVILQQNREITEQKTIIEIKNKDITDSIRYAKRLQNAILPSESKFREAFSDFFLLYQPKDIVSGDIYWFTDISNEKEKDFLFAVIDCTGHGVPGGFVSIVAHNSLNRAVKEFGLREPGEILNKVNELVEDHFKTEKGEEIRDGMDISLCRLKVNNTIHECWFAGANNPLWIVTQDKQLKEIKADPQPIGRYIDRKPFTMHQVNISPGDKIYMFSDGYADQFGGPKGKKFKYSQLKEILIATHSSKMSSQKKILHSRIEEWKSGYEQIDDICVLGWTI